MGFQDLPYAQQLRDAIRKIAGTEIQKLRPEPRNATVVDIDSANGTATVLFAGDDTPVPVRIYTVRPRVDGGIGVGDVVRVEGPPARRYVTEVVNGDPLIRAGALTLTSLASSGLSANVTINLATGEIGYSSSSRRYKKNIRKRDVKDSSIADLRVVSFQTKDGDETTYIGLIAEEVAQNKDLDFLITWLDGKPEAINYDRVGVALVPVVQRLLSRVEQLENQLAEIQNNK